jgi:hypothetical protein
MDQERLHGSFSWMDVRTLIKFHVLLGKSALECYKSLKEGLWTRASSYEIVCQWMDAVKNSWEGTDNAPRSGVPTSATNECHVEQVKNVLERVLSISCTAVAIEVGISPASVYPFPINNMGKRKVCGYVLNADQRATYVHLSTIHLQHWRNEGNAFLDYILTVDESWMHSFDPHQK